MYKPLTLASSDVFLRYPNEYIHRDTNAENAEHANRLQRLPAQEVESSSLAKRTGIIFGNVLREHVSIIKLYMNLASSGVAGGKAKPSNL